MVKIADVASKLARSPLGIIALFLVFVEAIAALVLGFSDKLDPSQRWVLLVFIVILPSALLASFIYLVVKHHTKLYAPSDFRDERHFVQLTGGRLEALQRFTGNLATHREEIKNKIEQIAKTDREKAERANVAYAKFDRYFQALQNSIARRETPGFVTVLGSTTAAEDAAETTATASPVAMSDLRRLLDSYQEAGRVEPVYVPEDYSEEGKKKKKDDEKRSVPKNEKLK